MSECQQPREPVLAADYTATAAFFSGRGGVGGLGVVVGMLARENVYFNRILALADGACSLLSL